MLFSFDCQAGLYAKCIVSRSVDSVPKDSCATEFMKLKKCVEDKLTKRIARTK